MIQKSHFGESFLTNLKRYPPPFESLGHRQQQHDNCHVKKNYTLSFLHWQRQIRRVFMFKIGQIPQHKPQKNTKSFNGLRHYIANTVLFAECEEDLILPSTRELAEIIGYSKALVSRHFFDLEELGWVEKKKWGDHPRQCLYLAVVSREKAERFKNYYLLHPAKKQRLLKIARRIDKSLQRVGEM